MSTNTNLRRRGQAGRALLAAVVAAASAVGLNAAIGPSASAQTADPADALKLNELQFLGSHNSSHIAPDLGLYRFMNTVASSFGQDPKDLLYTHQPLITQFMTQGIRQVELDVFADPDGGRYANPVANLLGGLPEYSADYNNWSPPELAEPGTKVLHIQDFDMKSNCVTLKICLTDIKRFSDANPEHVPITVLIEAKDDELPDVSGIQFVKPLPWTTSRLDTLDSEIRAVLGDRLFTPDDMRGSAANLNTAVTTTGWPTLGELRGKVIFLMDNEGAAKTNYLSGHPLLENRVMFVSASPGDPNAAFVKLNDPQADAAAIDAAVRAGYVVRTRADTPTDTIETGSTTQRDAAFASGAQWVSTDYPRAGMSTALNSVFSTNFMDYSAPLPGGAIARCNPITAPACGLIVSEPTLVQPPDPTSTTSVNSTVETLNAPTSTTSVNSTVETLNAPTTTTSAPAPAATPAPVAPRYTG